MTGSAAEPRPDYVDVLIVGAGISGIGAAYYLQRDLPGRSYTIIEARGAIGGTWDLFRYPGIRSDSDLHTFGYEFKPWRDENAIAAGEKILAYLHETVAENNIESHIRLPPSGRRGGVVECGRPVDHRRRTHRHRRAHATERELDLLRQRLLPLRRGVHPALRGPGAVPGRDRASAALAGGPRLRRQAGGRHRQRCHRRHARPGVGRAGRARDDVAALAVLRRLAARQGSRGERRRQGARRQAWVCTGTTEEHRAAADRLQTVPAVSAAFAAPDPSAHRGRCRRAIRWTSISTRPTIRGTSDCAWFRTETCSRRSPRPGIRGDRPNRHLHRDRHPAGLGPSSRCRHHRHRNRIERPAVRRDDRDGRRGRGAGERDRCLSKHDAQRGAQFRRICSVTPTRRGR